MNWHSNLEADNVLKAGQTDGMTQTLLRPTDGRTVRYESEILKIKTLSVICLGAVQL